MVEIDRKCKSFICGDSELNSEEVITNLLSSEVSFSNAIRISNYGILIEFVFYLNILIHNLKFQYTQVSNYEVGSL